MYSVDVKGTCINYTKAYYPLLQSYYAVHVPYFASRQTRIGDWKQRSSRNVVINMTLKHLRLENVVVRDDIHFRQDEANEPRDEDSNQNLKQEKINKIFRKMTE